MEGNNYICTIKRTGNMQNSNNNSSDKREQIIQLPKIIDERGNLSFVEEEKHIPFKIARSYWIYDVPGGEIRGSHAFRKQEEFIIALSGSFDVVLNDGKEIRKYSLNRSYTGIHIPAMTWRALENFSTNSLCLVLSSLPYDPDDYVWNYEEFIKEKSTTNKLPDIISSGKVQVPMNLFKLPSLDSFSAKTNSVYHCQIFQLPKHQSNAGNLTAINNHTEIPFDIKRVYYTYDIPSGATRGGHAHKELYQYLIAASSSFDVLLDDGQNKKIVHLDRPNYALMITPGIWRELLNFSSGAICMVLASEKYIESDYFREYTEFLSFKSWK